MSTRARFVQLAASGAGAAVVVPAADLEVLGSTPSGWPSSARRSRRARDRPTGMTSSPSPWTSGRLVLWFKTMQTLARLDEHNEHETSQSNWRTAALERGDSSTL